jgi:hypothetical protein
MEVDTVTDEYSFPDVEKTVSWHTDTGISSISEDIFSHLKQKQQTAAEEGALDIDHPDYTKPIDKERQKFPSVFVSTSSAIEERYPISPH